MSERPYSIGLPVLLGLILPSFGLHAEEHAVEALKHAEEAARSTDSKAIGEHAEQALQHIEAAKATPGAKADPHLKQGESDLNSAVKHSQWHNTDRAVHEAEDGKAHLEDAVRK